MQTNKMSGTVKIMSSIRQPEPLTEQVDSRGVRWSLKSFSWCQHVARVLSMTRLL